MDSRSRRSRPKIQVVPDYAQVCDVAASLVLASARRAIVARGCFSIALSGGSTPRGVYERLGTAPLAEATSWPAWQIFWGDERWVSPRDPRSNYHMARTTLLDHVPVDTAKVYPMVSLDLVPAVAGGADKAEDETLPAEAGEKLATAAAEYESTLVSNVAAGTGSEASSPGASREPPQIDLVLLGLGDDGHTASLFPGARSLQESRRWVVATAAPGGERERQLPRLTLTLPVLNAAREVVFLVSGAAKSSIVAAVLGAHGEGEREQGAQILPAARVVPADGRLTWLLDEDARGEIPARI